MNTSVGEESGAKVKYKVDASELLPGLDKNAGECTEEDPIVRGTEAVHVRTLAKFLLVSQVEANLLKLGADLRIIIRE